jgi:hypothetical protein
MSREHINPMQWHQSLGVARQVSARIFRDGGTAADAMRSFGLTAMAEQAQDWSKAVEAIAEALCTQNAGQQPLKRAA